jgi:hypothetical protein
VDEEHKWREEVHKRRFMVFVILPNVIATITNLLVICGYLRRNAYFYLPQIISLVKAINSLIMQKIYLIYFCLVSANCYIGAVFLWHNPLSTKRLHS